MGLFDFLKKKEEPQVSLRDLIVVDYTKQYAAECQYIRENYIPEQGPSEVLQGELLREIELLRSEAKEHGNSQWDMDCAYFCENIKWKLINLSIYTEEELLKINLIIDYLKYTGDNKISYTKDNLYDILADLVGKLQNVHPDPISCEINYSVQR